MTDTAFSSLPLPAEQLRNLQALGYSQMTPIQAASLPLAMQGADLIGQAVTGSGKTAALAIPLLDRLNQGDLATQGLVLCPTRELAMQVAGEIRRLARYRHNTKVVTLCGGQALGPQIASLEHGAQVVVGTPGRICDHLRRRTLDLGQVNCLVLDEADRMLEMGFLQDMETIIGVTPARRQTLLFSATFPEDIRAISARFQRSPQHLSVAAPPGSKQIDERFFVCEQDARPGALLTLLAHFQPESAVVFCNTRQAVREVFAYLCVQGISAAELHGEMEQRDRDRVLVRFRQHSCRVLVATDVAARGLDIDKLPAVINYELPRVAEDYIHRIGRTGRAGETGLALSLLTTAERYLLDRIGDLLQREPAFESINTLTGGAGGMPLPACTTLEIAGGRKDKVRPGDILGALTGEAGIAAQDVGRIDVMDRASFVAIARHVADRALGRLLNGRIKGRKFKVRKL